MNTMVYMEKPPYRSMNEELAKEVFENLHFGFNTCTDCGIDNLPLISIKATDKEAVHAQKAKERLCRKCARKSKSCDDVITWELKKAGKI